jgi:hypothetical protein
MPVALSFAVSHTRGEMNDQMSADSETEIWPETEEPGESHAAFR